MSPAERTRKLLVDKLSVINDINDLTIDDIDDLTIDEIQYIIKENQLYVGFEPPVNQNDRYVSIFDTGGNNDDGNTSYPMLELRIRMTDYNVGYQIAEVIRTFLDDSVENEEIFAYRTLGDIQYKGIDNQYNKMCYIFILNVLCMKDIN